MSGDLKSKNDPLVAFARAMVDVARDARGPVPPRPDIFVHHRAEVYRVKIIAFSSPLIDTNNHAGGSADLR